MPEAGHRLFSPQIVPTEEVENHAKRRGWDGGDNILDYAHPEDLVECLGGYPDLDRAVLVARQFLAKGKRPLGREDFFGQITIREKVWTYDDLTGAWDYETVAEHNVTHDTIDRVLVDRGD